MSVLDIDAPTVRERLVQFIRDQMTSAGFEHGIIGLSGGLDSAVTTHLAAEALTSANVIGLILPYRSTSPECQKHAELVVTRLGIKSQIMDITPQIDAYFAQFPQADRLRRANKIARERMSIL